MNNNAPAGHFKCRPGEKNQTPTFDFPFLYGYFFHHYLQIKFFGYLLFVHYNHCIKFSLKPIQNNTFKIGMMY